MTRYTIQEWRRGRPVTYRFSTLDAAREAANRIFRETGIIVGIEQEQPRPDTRLQAQIDAAREAIERNGYSVPAAVVSREPRGGGREVFGFNFRPGATVGARYINDDGSRETVHAIVTASEPKGNNHDAH